MELLRFKAFYYLSLSILLLLSGCSYKANFKPITRDKAVPEYTRVGCVIPSRKALIKDRIELGMSTGMEYGGASCAVPGFFLSPEGVLFGTMYFVVCLPIGSTIGAVKGTYESGQLEALKKEKGTIQVRLNTHGVYAKLQDISVDYARENQIDASCVEKSDELYKEDNTVDYAFLAARGIDTAIEFEVNEVLLDETGIVDVPVNITLQVKSKLIRTADGTTLDTAERKTISRVHNYEEWVANDFALLSKEFDQLLETVARSIVDEQLLVYYPSFSKEPTDAKNAVGNEKLKRDAPYYVLRALYPEPTFRFGDIREAFLENYRHVVELSFHTFTLIKEQQPIFRWESFPWTFDQVSQERFSDIVYDLEIYEFGGSLVYARRGLKETKHQVEDVLKRDTKYVWTVRARFKLDGKTRVTEWGGLYDLHHPAWTFGKQSGSWDWQQYWPLSAKQDHYYPFIIIED